MPLDGEVGTTEVGIENIIENVLGRFCDGAQLGYACIHVEDINPSRTSHGLAGTANQVRQAS
jgi:hypothetical protein